MNKCVMCGEAIGSNWESYCKKCKPIAHICCTSADETIKYGIPGQPMETLEEARLYEFSHSKRKTVIAALERAIKKLGGAS